MYKTYGQLILFMLFHEQNAKETQMKLEFHVFLPASRRSGCNGWARGRRSLPRTSPMPTRPVSRRATSAPSRRLWTVPAPPASRPPRRAYHRRRRIPVGVRVRSDDRAWETQHRRQHGRARAADDQGERDRRELPARGTALPQGARAADARRSAVNGKGGPSWTR